MKNPDIRSISMTSFRLSFKKTLVPSIKLINISNNNKTMIKYPRETTSMDIQSLKEAIKTNILLTIKERIKQVLMASTIIIRPIKKRNMATQNHNTIRLIRIETNLEISKLTMKAKATIIITSIDSLFMAIINNRRKIIATLIMTNLRLCLHLAIER